MSALKAVVLLLVAAVLAACGSGGENSLPGGTITPTIVLAKSGPAQGKMNLDLQGTVTLHLYVTEGLIDEFKGQGYKWSDVTSVTFVGQNMTARADVTVNEKEVAASVSRLPQSETWSVQVGMKDGNQIAVNFDAIDFNSAVAVTYTASQNNFHFFVHI